MQPVCRNIVQLCPRARHFSSTSIALARQRPKSTRPKSHPALPVPSNKVPEVVVPDTHALWGFFRKTRETMTPPKDDSKHGRAWTAEELRRKSFDDLHALWIVCLKERNILATQRHERRRQKIREEGNAEAGARDQTVRRTMAGIKFVLNERFLAYQQAVELASQDEKIDFKRPKEKKTNKSPLTYYNIEKNGKGAPKKIGNSNTSTEEAVQIDAANSLKAQESTVAA